MPSTRVRTTSSRVMTRRSVRSLPPASGLRIAGMATGPMRHSFVPVLCVGAGLSDKHTSDPLALGEQVVRMGTDHEVDLVL